MEWAHCSCYELKGHEISVHSCFLMLGPGEDRRNPADLLFIAGVFQSSCKKSIPYVSGGVVFLGHSLLISSSSFSNTMALILCRISLPTITTHSSAHCQHEEQLVNGWDPRRHFGPVVRKLYFLFIPFEIIFSYTFFVCISQLIICTDLWQPCLLPHFLVS